MSTPSSHEHYREPSALRERWVAQYGPVVALQLEPQRRYSIVRIGAVEYAFTDYDRYARALRRIWDARRMPEPLGSAAGSDLLDIAPNLQAVDPDPDDAGGPFKRSRFT
jgi:hypothetical protein